MADVPSLRRKPALRGLMPSAMNATLTPLPSMPNAAAVTAEALSERALIVLSASGSSRGLFGSVEHAAAGTTAAAAAEGAAAAAATAGAGVTGTKTSGDTFSTAGSAASAAACAVVTVAENALPNV